MTKPYANIDARGLGIPTPRQLKDDGEKTGIPVALVRIEMNGWWREHAVFNPKAFLENPAAQDAAMAMFRDELIKIITNGLKGPAPK